MSSSNTSPSAPPSTPRLSQDPFPTGPPTRTSSRPTPTSSTRPSSLPTSTKRTANAGGKKGRRSSSLDLLKRATFNATREARASRPQPPTSTSNKATATEGGRGRTTSRSSSSIPTAIPPRTSNRPDRSTPSVTPGDISPERVPTSPENDGLVTFLQRVADHRWNYLNFLKLRDANRNIRFDAAFLVRLVMQGSLIARDPQSTRAKRFADVYRADATRDMNRVRTEYLQNMIRDYFRRLDELFFLSLLARRIRGGTGERPLVMVAPERLTPDRQTIGTFIPGADAIRIYLRPDANTRHPLDRLLVTLVHQAVHAYLHIFSDKRHRNHAEWVDDSDGHGKMFQMLFRFILSSIFVHTRSDQFWKQVVSIEEEIGRCSRPRLVTPSGENR